MTGQSLVQGSQIKSVWASVQLTNGSRGVRISGSNAGYTMFRGSVKGTGYPLHSPASPSLPLPRVTVCHHISLDSNAAYTMFRGSVMGTGYTPHSQVSPSLPPRMHLLVPSHFNWSLPLARRMPISSCPHSLNTFQVSI